jgi:hypothetical protein
MRREFTHGNSLRVSMGRVYHGVIIFIEFSKNILNEVFIIKRLPHLSHIITKLLHLGKILGDG